jgi:hypothetical protein
MKDSRYNFKMADIRKCFSTIGDTTLSKWIDKGLIGCDSDKKGIRTNIRYSALGIVHVGVLTQLSTWGVLTYYKETEVSLGYLGIEAALLEPEVPASLGEDLPNRCNFPLTEPDEIINYYSSHGPNLIMIVTSRQVPFEQEDKRMRWTKTVFEIKILTPEQAFEWESDQQGLPRSLQEMTILTFESPPNKEVPEANVEFGFLKLDIGRIIRHVYKKLDILYLLS